MSVLVALATLSVVIAFTGARADGDPQFSAPIKLAGAGGDTEPRPIVGPDGRRWVITSNSSGRALVYGSGDGLIWNKVTDPAGQNRPTIDVDIVVTRTGRVIATELDLAGVNLRVSYSDDNGETWSLSAGPTLADQDRQWLAVGPDDLLTGQPRVYLLYHNLAGAFVAHNMWVMTSIDNGATFGPPVPITLPGSDAWLDLQCADSGGPDALRVEPSTGRLYVLWGTRSAPVGGGCGASVFGTPEFNIVASTRLWTATSPDASPGSWTASLAVDDSPANRVVGMQGADLAIDRGGNVYVLYVEAPNPYPDFSGAALRYRWAPPGLTGWSTPVTVVPEGGAGNILPHVVAGDPGKLDAVWFAGERRADGEDFWYTTVAQVTDATGETPSLWMQRVSSKAAYRGRAAALMGTCDTGPAGGIQSGIVCTRITDVWGATLDQDCNLIAAWPSVTNSGGGTNATFVTTQTGGRTICSRTA